MAASDVNHVIQSFCKSVQALDLPQQIQLAAAFLSSTDPQLMLAAAFEEAESTLKVQEYRSSGDHQQYVFSCIAVSVHILKQEARYSVVEQFVDEVIVPALQLEVDPALKKCQLQVAVILSELLQQHGLWKSALCVLRCCATALSESASGVEPDNSAHDTAHGQLPGSYLRGWPLPSVCSTVQQLLEAGCKAKGREAACSFLDAALQLLMPPTLALLCTDNMALRKAAVHRLLPVMFDAASLLGGEPCSKFCSSVAQHCITGMQAKGATRQSAMALAVQFGGLLQQELHSSCMEQQEHFWSALQACLVDAEPLTRKRAAHVLRAMLATSNLRRTAWGTWLMLYGLLDEFAAHLIRPAWEQINTLHAPATAYNSTQQEAGPQPRNKKMLRGRKGIRTQGGAASQVQGEDGVPDKRDILTEAQSTPKPQAMEANMAQGAPASLDALDPTSFTWMCIIWERALLHPNIQVQKLTFHTFLQRDWGASYTNTVPPDFISGVLLPALLVHTPIKAAADKTFNPQEALVEFLQRYIAACPPLTRKQLFRMMLDAACAKEPLPRQGLLLLLGSFSAAAGRAQDTIQDFLDGDDKGIWSEEVLAALVSCTIYLSSYHGVAFRTAAYRSILNLARSLTNPCSLAPASAARLLQELPFHEVQPEGSLHEEVLQWLVPTAEAQAWFTGRLLQQLESYLNDAASSSTGARELNDMDFKVWEARSRSWSLLAVVCGEAATPVLRPLLQALAVNMQAIRTRPYLAPGVAERTLILLESLLFYALAHVRAGATNSKRPSTTTSHHIPTTSSTTTPNPSPGSGPITASTTAAGATTSTPSGGTAHTATVSLPSGAAASPATSKGSLWVSPFAGALLSLINSHTALLAACCESAAQVFWSVPPHMTPNAAAEVPESTTSVTISPALKLASSKALKAVQCVGQALQLLSCLSALQGHNLAAAIGHLLKWSQDFSSQVQKLSEGHLREWAGTQLQHDMLMGIEAVFRSLTVASSMQDVQMKEKMTGVCNPATVLLRVLQVPTSSGVKGERSAQQWSCIDAILGLSASIKTGIKQTVLPAVGHSAEWPTLAPSTAARLLLEALKGLPGCPYSQLLPLLRCTRVLWCMSLTSKDVAESVSSQLAGRGDREGTSLAEAVAWVVARALMEALDLCAKRKAALCAAFVNTALLPHAIAYKETHLELVALHQPGGPVHWLVDSMVKLNRPRVLVPLCIRLAVHISIQPQLVAHYTQLLQHLLVFASLNKGGSGLDLETSIDEVEAEELGVFNQQDPDPLLQSHNGTTIAARLALVCALYTVALNAGLVHPALQEPPISQQATGAAATAASTATTVSPHALQTRAAGLALWDSLYTLATTDPLLSSDKYKVGSDLHRQKVRCWQVLTVLSNFLPEERAEAMVKELMELFNQNNASQVKMYQEAICTALLLRQPVLLESLLLPELQDVSRVRNSISSLILVAAQVALHLPQELRDRLLPEVVQAVAPWGLCHAHTVRTFTQLVLHTVFERVPLDSSLWRSLGPSSGNPLLRRWMAYLDSNQDMVRLRNTLGAVMPRFTPRGLTSPNRVFVEGVQLAGGSEEGVTFEGAPASIMDRLQDFLTYERSRLRDTLQERESQQEYFPDTGLHAATHPLSLNPNTTTPGFNLNAIVQTSKSDAEPLASQLQQLDSRDNTSRRHSERVPIRHTSDFQRKVSPLDRMMLPPGAEMDPLADLADLQNLGLWDESEPPHMTSSLHAIDPTAPFPLPVQVCRHRVTALAHQHQPGLALPLPLTTFPTVTSSQLGPRS